MRRLSVATAVGVLALLCACEPDPEQEKESMENQQIVDAIAADIDRPAVGFTKVDGVYRDDASTAQQVSFSIRCDNCDARTVIDQVVEAVWTSEVRPLRTISVSVTGPDGYEGETIVLADHEAELTERYGARPSD
ncbi:hypothetical protein [Nocardioides antri]|uniref:Lipoprotein n=1 Tax=Nocardioides antri TaxID=2607659 RepID=A0A5B1M502_9ACTN|nr:hypothetical protein [Nocardioides antri]KAA1427219.1 hypothetical protein F0U47_06860 [Nocardioides antri]